MDERGRQRSANGSGNGRGRKRVARIRATRTPLCQVAGDRTPVGNSVSARNPEVDQSSAACLTPGETSCGCCLLRCREIKESPKGIGSLRIVIAALILVIGTRVTFVLFDEIESNANEIVREDDMQFEEFLVIPWGALVEVLNPLCEVPDL